LGVSYYLVRTCGAPVIAEASWKAAAQEFGTILNWFPNEDKLRLKQSAGPGHNQLARQAVICPFPARREGDLLEGGQVPFRMVLGRMPKETQQEVIFSPQLPQVPAQMVLWRWFIALCFGLAKAIYVPLRELKTRPLNTLG
jgi:hypothetical protein